MLADLVLVAVQDAEVEHQQGHHQAHEGQPHPGWLAQPVGQKEGQGP